MRRHGKCSGHRAASKASDAAVASATEKDTVRSRLGGTPSLVEQPKRQPQRNWKRTLKQIPETMQALDTLADKYEAFEVTMKNVACDREEVDVLNAMAAEVAEELDRAHKEQERLQYELEFICGGIVTASKEFTSSWALHNAACEIVNDECKIEWSLQGSQQPTGDPRCRVRGSEKSEPENLCV